ncbi:hypothetical protein U9M48_016901 [Paspalum notatum var. saurae]|uniref:N-acetyltransferase domain-containing protein n=1 Tax=Paspalum notatum var. saurae TaxID=547442 RepID=A0AAQ3T6H6_PASNO
MQWPRQAQQPGAPSSWEPNGVQARSVPEEPSSPAPARGDVEMLSEDEMASLTLLGLRENCSTTQSDPMHGDEGPAAEQIEALACGGSGMPDVKEIRNGAGEQPRYSGLSTIAPVKVHVMGKKYKPDSYLKNVRGLLSTGLLEGFDVIYKKDEVEITGRIRGQRYSCGCSQCNYSCNVMTACGFEEHSGQSSKNQNNHIFLQSGISLVKVVKALKQYRLGMLGEVIEKTIGFSPNLEEYSKWKASFQNMEDHLGVVVSDGFSTQSQDYLKESATSSILDLHWSASKRRSGRRFRQRGTEASSITSSGGPDKRVCGIDSKSKESLSGSPDKRVCSIDSKTKESLSGSPDKTVCNIDSKSKESKTRDTTLHPLIFKEGGLPDNTRLTYKLKNGEFTPSHFEEHAGMGRRRQPYHNIYTLEGITLHELSLQLQDRLYSNGFGNSNLSSFSDYPNLTSSERRRERKKKEEEKREEEEQSPSYFRRLDPPLNYPETARRSLKPCRRRRSAVRLPQRLDQVLELLDSRSNVQKLLQICPYTSKSLRDLLAALTQDAKIVRGRSHGKGSWSGPPDIMNPSCDKEPSTTSGPIVPLKRTLQERAVQTESCYLCGYGYTSIGSLDPNTIAFCNQCERPCHVKCYNKELETNKAPLEVLKAYVHFGFWCCKECQSLHDRLDGLEKCEEIISLRKMRSQICWRFLHGMSGSSDTKLYLPQVIGIFKDAFVETTDEHSDAFSDMVYAKDTEGEKNFRGMYCALLTASTHVVSAAILKVRMKEIAELVLVATRSEFRKKGYFILLLKSIETHLRNCNVSLLVAPVDPEMAQIWSERLGFTILSAEEKKSMLEWHPLVMFENLDVVKKSLVYRASLRPCIVRIYLRLRLMLSQAIDRQQRARGGQYNHAKLLLLLLLLLDDDACLLPAACWNAGGGSGSSGSSDRRLHHSCTHSSSAQMEEDNATRRRRAERAN